MTAYRPTAARTALARETDSEISGETSRDSGRDLNHDSGRGVGRDIDRAFDDFHRDLGRNVRPDLDRNVDRGVDRPAGRDVGRGRAPAGDGHSDLDAGFGAGDQRRRPPFAPSSLIRGRAMFAAVTFGALTAAAAGQSLLPKVAHDESPQLGRMQDVSVVFSTVSDNQDSLVVAPPARQVDPSAEVAQLVASQQAMSQQGNTADQATVSYVKPTDGTVVSTFGGQYGTFHYGIEIAGSKDQPIVAVAAGKIIAAGPASGFGLWVKEELPDGTILVYARVADYSVHVGQAVTAGEQIAGMGDGGFSTGYTLHFEVWDPDNKKVDPESWLNAHGVIV